MDPFDQLSDIASMSGREFETRCRQFCQYAYLDNKIALCRVLSKYKIYVDVRDTGIAPHFIMDGFWETWLTQCLAGIVKPGDTCIDIGANFGYFSLLMAGLSGDKGTTIAVEPNPGLAKLLRLTGNMNSPGFRVAEVALSDTSGKVTLNIPQTSFGDASIIDRKDRQQVSKSKVKVNMLTLDQLLKEMNVSKVDVIKIDVEGVEPDVFRGMQETLAANPDIRIIIEYSPYLYSNPRAFTEYLFSRFTVNRIKDVNTMKKLDPSSIDELLALKDHTDLYLLKKEPAVISDQA